MPGLNGHGKKQIMKILQNNAEARELHASVGSKPSLNEDTNFDMDQFILTNRNK